MNKQLYILLSFGVILLVIVILFRFGDVGARALWNLSNGGKLLLPLVGIAALIDSINPCAFSILLLTIAFLFSIGTARSGIVKIGGLYILGIFVVYVLIGLGIIQALHLFNTPHFMAKVGASLLIAFGAINLINDIWPAFPIKLKIPQAAHLKIAELMEKSSMPAAFLLGALVGLCEFPCTGGPYLMVLGLLHDKATYFRGFAYLILYNFIFVLPLVVILLIASNSSLVEKVQYWKKENMRQVKFWSGLAMIALGVIILLI
jgi:cytochrome c biogenesis protein CcdA